MNTCKGPKVLKKNNNSPKQVKQLKSIEKNENKINKK